MNGKRAILIITQWACIWEHKCNNNIIAGQQLKGKDQLKPSVLDKGQKGIAATCRFNWTMIDGSLEPLWPRLSRIMTSSSRTFYGGSDAEPDGLCGKTQARNDAERLGRRLCSGTLYKERTFWEDQSSVFSLQFPVFSLESWPFESQSRVVSLNLTVCTASLCLYSIKLYLQTSSPQVRYKFLAHQAGHSTAVDSCS